MQYMVQSAAGARPAFIEPLAGEGQFSLQLGDDVPFEVLARSLPDGAISLHLAGRHWLVRPGAHGAEVSGHFVPATVHDVRTWALRTARGHHRQGAGAAAVTAPMAGRIARQLVAEGEVVECGQGLVVVEAMKMENEVVAPRAGVVRALAAAAGSLVELDAPLCRIE